MNGRRLLFVVYYLACATVIALLMGQRGLFGYYRFASSGVAVQAKVVATDCGSKSPVNYRYEVGGATFTGSGPEGSGNPMCVSLKPGDPLLVYYLPDRPQTSLPGDPRDPLVIESAGVAMAALFVPLVILFAAFVLIRRFRNAGETSR